MGLPHLESPESPDFLFHLSQVPGDDGERGEWEVTLNADHPILKGHFPGMPVVPGVMQLFLVRRVCEGLIGHPLCWTEIHRAKFFKPWTPEAFPRVRMRVRTEALEGHALKVEASVFSEQVQILSLKGILRK